MKKFKKITCIVLIMSMSLTGIWSVLAKSEDTTTIGGKTVTGKTTITKTTASATTTLVRNEGATRKVTMTYSYYAYNATKPTEKTVDATGVGGQVSTVTVSNSEKSTQVHHMVKANSKHSVSFDAYSCSFPTSATYSSN